jgi:hypothetical protein
MTRYLKLPEEWHNLLHRLWSKATKDPDYVKAEWMQLESILFKAAKICQENEDESDATSST